MKPTPPAGRSRLVAVVLSVVIPGLGQGWLGDWPRALGVFLATATALGATLWYGKPAWLALPAVLWLWNVYDCLRLPRGAPIWVAALLWLGMAYGIGWQATEINPRAFIENSERARSVFRPMLEPDFLTPRTEVRQGWVEVEVPCSSAPPRAEHTVETVTVRVSPDCASLTEALIITADGLWPNESTQVYWSTPIGDIKLVGGQNNAMLLVTSDEAGKITALIRVPPSAQDAMPDPTIPLKHRVYIEQERKIGGIEISRNGRYILQGIYETLAMALLTTTLGAVLALPLSFPAARNLMSGHAVTLFIYVVIRTILNILRSIEALIMAIIFVVIVGLGPFAGMLALTVHTVAALAKLYSEVVEGIDPGPIEAVRATGANWLQVVRYAVVPQIVPLFTALTIYRWDINVRSSTIIGFVGGGGIGYYLWQWLVLNDYRAVSSCFIAIAVVILTLDFFSARVRARLA